MTIYSYIYIRTHYCSATYIDFLNCICHCLVSLAGIIHDNRDHLPGEHPPGDLTKKHLLAFALARWSRALGSCSDARRHAWLQLRESYDQRVRANRASDPKQYVNIYIFIL